MSRLDCGVPRLPGIGNYLYSYLRRSISILFITLLECVAGWGRGRKHRLERRQHTVGHLLYVDFMKIGYHIQVYSHMNNFK